MGVGLSLSGPEALSLSYNVQLAQFRFLVEGLAQVLNHFSHLLHVLLSCAPVLEVSALSKEIRSAPHPIVLKSKLRVVARAFTRLLNDLV